MSGKGRVPCKAGLDERLLPGGTALLDSALQIRKCEAEYGECRSLCVVSHSRVRKLWACVVVFGSGAVRDGHSFAGAFPAADLPVLRAARHQHHAGRCPSRWSAINVGL